MRKSDIGYIAHRSKLGRRLELPKEFKKSVGESPSSPFQYPVGIIATLPPLQQLPYLKRCVSESMTSVGA
jgi:AraC-like DNA-binding protein